MNDDINFEQDANAPAEGDSLARLTVMCRTLLNLQRVGAGLDADLADVEGAIRKLSEEDIPELLKEVGLSEVKLSDGTKVSVKEDLQCGLGTVADEPERRARALAWLTKENLGGVIKTEVYLPFGRGEQSEVEAVRQALAGLGYVAALREDVHYQTLKATLNAERARRAESRALGAEDVEDVPAELFALHVINRATLKLPDSVEKPGKIRKRA